MYSKLLVLLTNLKMFSKQVQVFNPLSHVSSQCLSFGARCKCLIFTLVCSFIWILLHIMNSVQHHKTFWKTVLSRHSLFYSSDAEQNKCESITPFAVRIALVWFMLRKRGQRAAAKFDGGGMQVVLLEQLSSIHDQWACFEPLFFPQKKNESLMYFVLE